MLSHGAHLVLTAEDAFNPSADPLYPTNIWPLPGPGMFGALFRKVRALPDESDESVASIWATHVRMALMVLMALMALMALMGVVMSTDGRCDGHGWALTGGDWHAWFSDFVS